VKTLKALVSLSFNLFYPCLLRKPVGFLYTVIHNRAIYRGQPADFKQKELIGKNLACLAVDRTG
jgi:hypothetical protein